MIIILSKPDDAHADHVESKLRARAAAFVRFDPADFPRAAEITLSYSSTGRRRCALRAGDGELDLDVLSAIWYRRPGRPRAHAALGDGLAAEFAEQECSSFVQSLWSSLDCLWFPAPPATVKQAGHKAAQLKLAGALGFELPPTLITNSSAELLAFYRQHNGNIVSKMAGHSFQSTVGAQFSRYTEVVSTRDIAHAQGIRYCPMIFQAYVPKAVELRVTVVGDQVFAAEIHSQESNHTRVDWRRYDFYKTPYSVHELPRDVNERCLSIVERLGLRYGAIDMVVTPDGRYVFIEINPNGQYLWVEYETGLPISEAVCDLLMSDAAGSASASGGYEASIGGVL